MGLLIGAVFYYCPLIYKRAHADSRLAEMPDSLLGVMITFLLHMIINSTGIFVMPLFPADIANALQICIGLICLLAAVAAVLLLFWQSRKVTESRQPS